MCGNSGEQANKQGRQTLGVTLMSGCLVQAGAGRLVGWESLQLCCVQFYYTSSAALFLVYIFCVCSAIAKTAAVVLLLLEKNAILNDVVVVGDVAFSSSDLRVLLLFPSTSARTKIPQPLSR